MQQNFQQQLQRAQQMCSNAANLVSQITQELQQLQQLSAISFAQGQTAMQPPYAGASGHAAMQPSYGAAGYAQQPYAGQQSYSGQQPYSSQQSYSGTSVNYGALSAVMNADRMDASSNAPGRSHPALVAATGNFAAAQAHPANIQAVMRADQFAGDRQPQSQTAAGASWGGASAGFGATSQAYGSGATAGYGVAGMSDGGVGAGYGMSASFGGGSGALQAVMNADRAAAF